MADLARIKRNVAKMAGMGAPEADIDGYIASEGVTIDDVRNFKSGVTQLQGTVGKFDPAQSGVSQNVEMNGAPIPQPQKPAYKTDLMSSTAATVNGIVNSIPFLQNTSDALIGAGGMLFGQDYGKTVEGLRAQREAIAQAAPVAKIAGEVGGTLGTLGALGASKLGAQALGNAGSLGTRLVNSGVSSAGIAGLNSFSQGKQGGEVLGDMAMGGVVGVAAPLAGEAVKKAGGAVADAITGAAQKRLTTEAIKGAPDATDLKSAASALFETGRAAKAAVKPDVFANFAANLVEKAKSAEIDEMLDGEALAAYRKMATMAQEAMDSGGISLARLHNLRQIAQDVAVDASKDRTKRFAKAIVDGLDDMIGNLKPDQLTGTGGKEAANALLDGISTWSRAKKLGVIEEAIYQARNQASGFENGLRIQFRALLKPDKRKQFTAAEIKAIEEIANGTSLANITRLIGKFGFGGGSASNALGGFLGGTAGFGLGGPLGAAAVAVGATGAKKLSEKLTEAGANRVANVVATPNIPIARQAPNLLAPARVPLEILIKGGGLSQAGN